MLKLFRKSINLRNEIKLFFVNYIEQLIVFVVAVISFYGFYGFYSAFGENNVIRFYWEVVLFIFILGTFVLTLRMDDINEQSKKIIPKIGFGMILSGIIILLGVGLVGVKIAKYDSGDLLVKIGTYVCLFGTLITSFCLSFLFVVFFKQLFLGSK